MLVKFYINKEKVDPKLIKEYRKQYYEKNKEKLLVQQRQYYENSKTKKLRALNLD